MVQKKKEVNSEKRIVFWIREKRKKKKRERRGTTIN